MKNQESKTYPIKISKPSKYKRIDAWAESSGEISTKEIFNIFLCDAMDSKNEKEKHIFH